MGSPQTRRSQKARVEYVSLSRLMSWTLRFPFRYWLRDELALEYIIGRVTA